MTDQTERHEAALADPSAIIRGLEPPPPEPALLKEIPRGQSAILQAEAEDLERELRSVKKKERWHFVWALTGMSPAALLVAMGLFLDGSYALVVPALVLGTVSQFYLGVKASGKAARLRRALEALRDEGQSASPILGSPDLGLWGG